MSPHVKKKNHHLLGVQAFKNSVAKIWTFEIVVLKFDP